MIGGYRILETDNRINIYGDTCILVTSSDVLHSWALPTLAAKVDAVPGRVNKLILHPKRLGVYYGQCSEICGRNHRFIPISLEIAFNLTPYFENRNNKG